MPLLTLMSRVCASSAATSLREVHVSLADPGVQRLLHFVSTKSLPFSTEDVKKKAEIAKNAL